MLNFNKITTIALIFGINLLETNMVLSQKQSNQSFPRVILERRSSPSVNCREVWEWRKNFIEYALEFRRSDDEIYRITISELTPEENEKLNIAIKNGTHMTSDIIGMLNRAALRGDDTGTLVRGAFALSRERFYNSYRMTHEEYFYLYREKHKKFRLDDILGVMWINGNWVGDPDLCPLRK